MTPTCPPATSTATATERDLVLTRLIEASRDRVFAAWTQRLANWWGPHGTITTLCEMDLRPGGVFRTVLRAADGTEYPTSGVFLEVVPPERIVFTDAFERGWSPSSEPFFTAVIALDAVAEHRTRCTIRARHWTIANRERHERMGFYQGWGECLDRLASHLAGE